jgi:hypothetical protein
MKSMPARLLAVIPFLAALYLIPVNLALNLPAARAYLNGLAPEHAWSWYPLRVELQGLAADGQTPNAQWQIDARELSASLSLVPLLRGQIRVHDLDLVDLDLRLRPRPQAPSSDDVRAERSGEPRIDLRRYFPIIRNRDPAAVAEPPTDASPVALEVDNIRLRGRHQFWVHHVRGTLSGEVQGSLGLDTGIGRIALASGALDLHLESLQVGPEAHVTAGASVQGLITMPPFRLSEVEGLQLFRIPDLDARIDLPVSSLDFLRLLVPVLDTLKLNGQGRLRGRVVLSRGEALGGTDLVVDAHALTMDLGAYDFRGDGSVEARVDPANEAEGDLLVRFDRVQAELEPAAAGDSPRVLFSGQGLTARLHAAEKDPTTTSNAKRAEELLSEVDLALTIDVPSMEVPDLAAYNRLLPSTWDLALLGGTGTVSGALHVRSDGLSLNLDLTSDEAALRWKESRATADLALALRARVDGAAGATLHLDGTTLHVADAEVASAGGTKAAHPTHATPWAAELKIAQGALTLPRSGGRAGDPIPSVAKVLKDQGLGAVLGAADGRLSASLIVSRLDWIAELLGRPLDMSLTGATELDAEIVLADGRPGRGTTLRVPRETLSLALLQHRVDGQGTATLTVEHGGPEPRLRLDVALEGGRMRRRDEPEPSIGEVRMDAEVRVAGPLGQAGDTADVNLKLHSARVHDMSVYNAYLPEHLPLALRAGEASLVGDLRFERDKPRGELLLRAEGIRMALDTLKLGANLRLDVLIRDGSAKDMRFDIAGSALTLDAVQVLGRVASFADNHWRARLQLKDAEAIWHKPMHLRGEAEIAISDTRPFVAALDDLRGAHGWIDNLLTLRDLAGHLRLTVDGERAIVQDALLGSAEMGVRFKGRTAPSLREAMLLVRWHNLLGALEMENDQRRFDLLDAPARFDAYRPGETPLPYRKTTGGRATPFAEAAPAAHPSGAGKGRHTPLPAPHRPPHSHDRRKEPENLFLRED